MCPLYIHVTPIL